MNGEQKNIISSQSESYDVLITDCTLCGILTAKELISNGFSVIITAPCANVSLTPTEECGIMMRDGGLNVADFAKTPDGTQMRRDVSAAYDKLIETALKAGHGDVSKRNMLIFSDKEDDALIEKEYKLRNFSDEDVGSVSRDGAKDIFSFDIGSGVYVYDGAAVTDMQTLANCVRDYVAVNGAIISEDSVLSAIFHDDDTERRFLCKTTSGDAICCDYVIDCRNYAEPSFYKSRGLKRTLKGICTIKTSPLENLRGWHEQCVIRDVYGSPMTFAVTKDNEIIVTWDRHGLLSQGLIKYAETYTESVLRSILFCSDNVSISTTDYSKYASYGATPIIGRDDLSTGMMFAHCGGTRNAVWAQYAASKITEDVLRQEQKNK